MSVLGWEVLQGCLYQEGIYYMKRVGLVVAYDGTKYSGWQTQPNGITIQGVLNDTLSELLGEKIETIGASRTDAGFMHLEMWRFLTPNPEYPEKNFLMH